MDLIEKEDLDLLQSIKNPADLRTLCLEDLEKLAQRIRLHLIQIVQHTGGHLGAGLGVVELTLALHTVFDTPKDRLIWDTGHQIYPHKMITGRLKDMLTLRQGGGLSGFAKRCESPYDCFGAGHASTSLSAGLGMAKGLHFKGETSYTVCVIGDGAMSAGMAYEALNNMASTPRLIIILNDNDMSISPSLGAFRDYLQNLRHVTPPHKTKTLFEDLGLHYSGPFDGHHLPSLLEVLQKAREWSAITPVLVHVVTQKGKGYTLAEAALDRGHAVPTPTLEKKQAFEDEKTIKKIPTFTQVFGQGLIDLAYEDEAIVAITAAMSMGTGLEDYKAHFPHRFFDVGIAEQHAVTFAAGLACEGLKPFVAIYSTFLQRAYDQVIHDVAIQNLPVRFALDRAGLVGADGPTHAGAFDLAYLMCVPNFVIMAPADEAELMLMMHLAAHYQEGPIAFRYPRGKGTGVPLPHLASLKQLLPLGKGRLVQEGSRVALLSLGASLTEAKKAAHLLARDHHLFITLADARFAKPLDESLLQQLVNHHDIILILEHGARGGFGSHVMHHLLHQDLLRPGHKVRALTLPDKFLEHDDIDVMYKKAGLDAEGICAHILSLL